MGLLSMEEEDVLVLFPLGFTVRCNASYGGWQEFSRDCAMTVIFAVAQVRKSDKKPCREGAPKARF